MSPGSRWMWLQKHIPQRSVGDAPWISSCPSLIKESLDFCCHLLLINPLPPTPVASFPSLIWIVQPEVCGSFTRTYFLTWIPCHHPLLSGETEAHSSKVADQHSCMWGWGLPPFATAVSHVLVPREFGLGNTHAVLHEKWITTCK